MKKLLIIVFVVAAGVPVLAQQSTSSTPSNSMTVAEANRANGTVQPVMKDGKPYSQWVAEEKAKGQAASAQGQNLAKRNSNGRNDGAAAAVSPQNTNVSEGPATGTGEMVTVRAKEPAPVKEQAPAKEAASPVSPFPKGTAVAQPVTEAQLVLKGTSQDPDAKPATVVTNAKSSMEGGDGPAPVQVESKTVKGTAAAKDAATANVAVPKGSSLDPDAKPAAPATMPTAPSLPAEHSGKPSPAKDVPSKTGGQN